jgi:hypothetical protein
MGQTNDEPFDGMSKALEWVGKIMERLAKFVTGLVKLFGALILIPGAIWAGAAMFRACDKPEPGPQKPGQVMMAPVQLTGRWTDSFGNYLDVAQAEAQISYRHYDVNGYAIGWGTGSVRGRQLNLSGYGQTFWNLLLGGQTHYAGEFRLDASGWQLTGTIPALGSDPIILTRTASSQPGMAAVSDSN